MGKIREAKPYKILPELSSKIVEKFWGKVKITANTNLCWEWDGTFCQYGIFYVKRVPYKAHRISYLISEKADPKEMQVCHTCDNPKCVNPSHFFLGTVKDNAQDALRKGRIGDDRLTVHQRLHPETIARGKRNGASKIDESKVFKIREEYATGKTSLNILGRKYGINGTTVFSIIHKKTWVHI